MRRSPVRPLVAGSPASIEAIEAPDVAEQQARFLHELVSWPEVEALVRAGVSRPVLEHWRRDAAFEAALAKVKERPAGRPRRK